MLRKKVTLAFIFRQAALDVFVDKYYYVRYPKGT